MITLAQHLFDRLPKHGFMHVLEVLREGLVKYPSVFPIVEEAHKLLQQESTQTHAETKTVVLGDQWNKPLTSRELARGREVIARGRSMRLPDSRLVRHAVGHIRLLHHIRPNPRSGVDLIGTILRSGKTITDEELRPDQSWPATPLLLECAGHMPKPKQFRDRGGWVPQTMYVLWRLDWEKRQWVEVARCTAVGLDWVQYLCPIVQRLLNPTATDREWVDQEHVSSVLASLLRRLDEELKEFGRRGKEMLLSQLYDQVTNRLVELDDPLLPPSAA